MAEEKSRDGFTDSLHPVDDGLSVVLQEEVEEFDCG